MRPMANKKKKPREFWDAVIISFRNRPATQRVKEFCIVHGVDKSTLYKEMKDRTCGAEISVSED